MAELKIVRDVKEFHLAGGVPERAIPGFPGQERIDLRKKLIQEEVGETLKAIEERNLVEVADGIADSIVVLVGTALELGIDLTAVWSEVHRSNMSKFPKCLKCLWVEGEEASQCPSCGGRGTLVLRRGDGKIMKPEGWTAPDIKSILEAKGSSL